MVLITIVMGVYKPTYNWGATHCAHIVIGIFKWRYMANLRYLYKAKYGGSLWFMDVYGLRPEKGIQKHISDLLKEPQHLWTTTIPYRFPKHPVDFLPYWEIKKKHLQQIQDSPHIWFCLKISYPKKLTHIGFKFVTGIGKVLWITVNLIMFLLFHGYWRYNEGPPQLCLMVYKPH
jgi:hypothetical protein